MMKLSSVFETGRRMPDRFANLGFEGGQNISPPFNWSDAPAGAKSFALSIIDLHPVAKHFVHWLVIDIPAAETGLPEGASMSRAMPAAARELNTTYGRPGYGGPRPPAGTGDHDYEVTVYALDVERLDLPVEATTEQFEAAARARALDSAKLTGIVSG